MEAVLQQVIEDSVLKAAKQAEDQLDDQIRALENLEDDDLERLRQQRIEQLKRQAKQKDHWRARGHGSLREIDTEKEFFAEMKGEDRMICHFYRENWPCKVRVRMINGKLTCMIVVADLPDQQVMDKHLQTLAQQHLETKFVKVGTLTFHRTLRVFPFYATYPAGFRNGKMRVVRGAVAVPACR